MDEQRPGAAPVVERAVSGADDALPNGATQRTPFLSYVPLRGGMRRAQRVVPPDDGADPVDLLPVVHRHLLFEAREGVGLQAEAEAGAAPEREQLERLGALGALVPAHAAPPVNRAWKSGDFSKITSPDG
eukprot:gene392-biopygen9002